MPNKRDSKTSKSQKVVEKYDDDEEFYDSDEFYNSEDDYASNSSQSGGDTDTQTESDTELGDDSATLDIDPDDEKDLNEDDKYDPINENEELEDPDEETDIDEDVEETEEDAGEEEGEASEVGDDEIDNKEIDGDYVVESKTCHLKNLNKDFIVLDEDDSNMYGKLEYKKISDENRESDNIMTYYEMVRIIGVRAQQFNLGAEPLVKGINELHPAKMAYVELIAKMTPFIIRRHLPGKKYEEWRVDELEIIHEIDDSFFVPEKFDWEALTKHIQGNNKSKKSDQISSNSRQSRISSSKKYSSKKSNSGKNSKSKKSGSKKSGSKKSSSKKSSSKKSNSTGSNRKKSGSRR